MNRTAPLSGFVAPARRGIDRDAIRKAAVLLEEKARQAEESFLGNLVIAFLAGMGATFTAWLLMTGILPSP